MGIDQIHVQVIDAGGFHPFQFRLYMQKSQQINEAEMAIWA
jgi:hypothetical protein